MFERMTPTLIIPLVNNVGSYRVRTLLDAGSSASWITRDVLKDVKFTRKGKVKMKVYYHEGTSEKKVEVVQVYIDIDQVVDIELPGLQSHGSEPSPYRPPIPINCFVTELFAFHKMVPGLQNFLRGCVNEQIIREISDPSSQDVDHSNLSLGSGLILSNTDKIQITNFKTKQIILTNLDLMLERTCFGYAISGKIPETLRPNTIDVHLENKGSIMMYKTVVSSEESQVQNQGFQAILSPDYESYDNLLRLTWEKESLGVS